VFWDNTAGAWTLSDNTKLKWDDGTDILLATTLNLTNPLTPAHGGTGASSFTDGFVILGSGSGALTALDTTADGAIMIGDGTTDPVALDVGSSTAITILGTVATGTWQATAIADAYIPDNITIDLATLATTVTITDNESTAENNPIVFVAGADPDGGSLGLETDGDAHYNPSTGTITAATFAGALTGNAGTATALQTARAIGGVNFDGTAAITPTTIAVTDTTDTTSFVGLWESATGDLLPQSDLGITYNAGTGTLDSTVITEGGNAVFNGTEVPGGELGGTFASFTVDATHSGSAHHSAVTVTDTTTIDMTLTGQDVKADSLHTAGDALTLTGADFDFDGGAAPGGELGGTWATPTVDATHSGSAHHTAATANSPLTIAGQDLSITVAKDIVAGSGLSGGENDVLPGADADTTIDLDINSLAAAAVAGGDFIPFWDITATATNKKITYADFEAALTHDSLVAGTIADHDTGATGAELDTLTDDSMADTLHRHSELSASDGSPNAAVRVGITGLVGINVVPANYRLWVEGNQTVAGTQDVMKVTGGSNPNNGGLLFSFDLAGSDPDRISRIQSFMVGADRVTPLALNPDGGSVGINKAFALSPLHIGLSTEDVEVVDAGSASATEQDWIEVEIGGTQGYIRVFASK
jgi:hypothetical protein